MFIFPKKKKRQKYK